MKLGLLIDGNKWNGSAQKPET